LILFLSEIKSFIYIKKIKAGSHLSWSWNCRSGSWTKNKKVAENVTVKHYIQIPTTTTTTTTITSCVN